MTDRSILIHAPADDVYPLIADPIRMAEWSPECVRCRWVGGAERAEVGARFRGTSRNGWRRWTTTSTIAEMRDGELFAWEVTYFRAAGRPVGVPARDRRRRRPAGRSGGRPPRPVPARGVTAHHRVRRTATSRNADTMESTLEAIKAAAEAQTSLTPAGRNRPVQGPYQTPRSPVMHDIWRGHDRSDAIRRTHRSPAGARGGLARRTPRRHQRLAGPVMRRPSGTTSSGRTSSASRWPARTCAPTPPCSAAAVRRRDGREIAGQLLRLLLAVPGSVSGRYPVGNTGGADVSAFSPMPVPDDLRPLLLALGGAA